VAGRIDSLIDAPEHSGAAFAPYLSPNFAKDAARTDSLRHPALPKRRQAAALQKSKFHENRD